MGVVARSHETHRDVSQARHAPSIPPAVEPVTATVVGAGSTSKRGGPRRYDRFRMQIFPPAAGSALIALLLALGGPAWASPQKPKDQKPEPPKGFVEMFVAGVLTTEAGPAVILRDKEETRLLPIFVGFAEADAIQRRLERRHFARPLTHDLLEKIMQDLGGTLVKIQVEDLKADTYVGTMFVKKGDEIRRFDARPSDMIALALGNRAPIYVSVTVLDTASDLSLEPDEEKPNRYDHPPDGIKTL